MNYKSEIYGTCRHNTKFHRFTKISTGTDESETGQKSTDNRRITMVSREEYENIEEETFSNSLYCRNVNDITLTNSYETASPPALPIERIPPDPGELSRNTVESLPDYATIINV